MGSKTWAPAATMRQAATEASELLRSATRRVVKRYQSDGLSRPDVIAAVRKAARMMALQATREGHIRNGIDAETLETVFLDMYKSVVEEVYGPDLNP